MSNNNTNNKINQDFIKIIVKTSKFFNKLKVTNIIILFSIKVKCNKIKQVNKETKE